MLGFLKSLFRKEQKPRSEPQTATTATDLYREQQDHIRSRAEIALKVVAAKDATTFTEKTRSSESPLAMTCNSYVMTEHIATQNSTLARVLSDIPTDILDMLWFKNGPRANYTPSKNTFKLENISISIGNQEEPSAIDINYPVDSSEPLLNDIDIGYYPSYARLAPKERFTYLNWLTDITKPISTGYVFIFYYGLERHVLFGDIEKAIKIISVLRKHHTNSSFLNYSADASILAIAKHKRPDLLRYIDFSEGSTDIKLFLKASAAKRFTSEDIISAHKAFGFTNTRYIKEHYELFKDTLEQKLEETFACRYYLITAGDIAAIKSTFTIVVANYSLMPEDRCFNLPNIASSPRVRNAINALLNKTHEQVKVALREERKLNRSYNKAKE